MITYRSVCTLLIFSLFFSACHTDDSLSPLPIEQSCLLIKQTSCETCGEDLFSYDTQGRLVSYITQGGNLIHVTEQKFSYDAYNRIAKIITYSDGVKVDSTSVFYADNTPYKDTDVNYRWTHYQVISLSDRDTFLVKASYDEKGRRNKVQSYSQGVLRGEDSFVFDENDDIISANYSWEGDKSRYAYQYHRDKKNKLRNVGELVTMSDGGGEPYSAHLVKKAYLQDDPSMYNTYIYQFNEQGYPQQVTTLDEKGLPQEQSSLAYQCNNLP